MRATQSQQGHLKSSKLTWARESEARARWGQAQSLEKLSLGRRVQPLRLHGVRGSVHVIAKLAGPTALK